MTATDTDLDALLDALQARARGRAVDTPLTNQAGDEVGTLAYNGRLVVHPGDVITSFWGNTTFDQTVETFASVADRNTQWPTPNDGAVSYTADTGTFWVRRFGAWVQLFGTPPATTQGTVQTFVDGTGEVWVAKAGVNGGNWRKARDVLRCSYYRAAAFNFSTGWTALGYDTQVADAYGLYAAGTGLFTAPIAGLYRVTQGVGGVTAAVSQWVQCGLATSDGVTVLRSFFASSATAGANLAAVAVYEDQLTAGTAMLTRAVAVAAIAGRNNRDMSFFNAAYLGTG